MSETTFENAKVGDRVWDIRYGWGRISHIDNRRSRSLPGGPGIRPHPPGPHHWRSLFPLSVTFNVRLTPGRNYDECFSFCGCSSLDMKRTLFWDEIKIVPPERPKRKVKKEVEVWLNVYPDEPFRLGNVHGSRKDADSLGSVEQRIACVRLTGTYEVEE
jgi:hypothetical protein